VFGLANPVQAGAKSARLLLEAVGATRTRRRKLLSLKIGRNEVKLASRSRKGPWRMSHNSIVQRAMTDGWLAAQGVPSTGEQWIAIRYPNQAT